MVSRNTLLSTIGNIASAYTICFGKRQIHNILPSFRVMVYPSGQLTRLFFFMTWSAFPCISVHTNLEVFKYKQMRIS